MKILKNTRCKTLDVNVII